MVAQHFRWDFIGLSTDDKPTPQTSNKVTDGSTFYCSDTSKLYVYCKDNWYERLPLGGGGGSSYTAGDGIDITDDTISVDTETIQPKLTAGTNITIDEDNVISAEGGGATVVQTTGASTTDVMSQKAVTDMVFADGANEKRVKIGQNSTCYNDGGVAIGSFSRVTGVSGIAIGGSSTSYEGTANNSTRGIAIGSYARTIGGSTGQVGYECIAIGNNANTQTAGRGAIALGAYSHATEQGQMDISTLATTNTYGYNNSQYRLLTGLYDGQSAHDAVTVEQVNSVIDAINTALSTNIPHIGATS